MGIEGRNAYTDLAVGVYSKLYFHQDRLGSTIRITKENGETIAWADYDAWGKPRSPQGYDMNMAGVDNVIGFTSYTYDKVLDLYFAQARFYDQNDRRFISVDPIKDGVNWYAYCGNSPVVFVDPSGLEAALKYLLEYTAENASPILTVIEGGLAAGSAGTAAAVGTSAFPMVVTSALVVGGVVIAAGSLIYASTSALKLFASAMELKSLELPPMTIEFETRDTITYKDINGIQHTVQKEEFQNLHSGFYTMTRQLKIDDEQFGKKIGKHALEFGLDASNSTHRQQIRRRINGIYHNPTMIKVGLYRGQGVGNAEGMVKFYIQGADVVVTDMLGRFITIFKDGINSPRVRNARIIYDIKWGCVR